MNSGISSTDLYSILGIFVAMLAGFYGIAKLMLSQATKDRDADRKERKELSSAIRLMARNSNKVAAATVRGADEAKQRNGHLAELVMESSKANQKLASSATKTIVTAIQNVQEQKVEHQTVKEQKTVKKGAK